MTVDIKPIGNTIGANVISQADYLVALAPGGDLVDGFQSGTAQSDEFNKVIRQSSMVSAALANVVATAIAGDILDDGDLAALIVKFTTGLGLLGSAGAWSTGDVKLTMKNVVDAGWVFCNDGTIGDAASGGSTRANADCQALFTLLWNNVSDTYAPVVTGRGVSAAADWAAHKKITLTKMLGRAMAVSGAGSGLTARVLGQNLGEEATALVTVNLASHSHAIVDPGHVHGVIDPAHSHSYGGSIWRITGGGGQALLPVGGGFTIDNPTDTISSATGISLAAAVTGITTANTGTGMPHNTMQPTAFVNAMIKL